MRSRGWLRATAGLVLLLYPASWRTRYGPELEEALDQHHVTPSTIVDLAASASHAHRHPELGPADSHASAQRLGSSLASMLLANVAFAVAWAEIVNVRVRNPRIWMFDGPNGGAEAVKAVALAGVVGLLAVMTAALLFLWSARLRPGRQRLHVVALLAGTSLALAAFVGLFAAGRAAIDSTASGALWWPSLLGWAVVSTGTAVAVARSTPDPRVLRPCTILVRLSVGSMALAVAGSVVVGASLALDAPAIGAPALAIMLMAGAMVWAAAALCRVGIGRPAAAPRA
jgi:hypothetical protein